MLFLSTFFYEWFKPAVASQRGRPCALQQQRRVCLSYICWIPLKNSQLWIYGYHLNYTMCQVLIYIYICFYIYIYIYIYINKQDLVFVALLCCYSVVATFGVFIQTVKEETLGESGRDREKDRHQKYTPQWLMSLADTAQANAPSLPKWTFWICCVQMFNLFSCLGGFIRLDSSGCICCSD